jgi:plasmid stabilization system protein ParE
MEYHVELTNRAVRDLSLLFLSINAHEADAAARWFNGMEEAIGTLSHSPHRCPIAPESRPRRLIRHLLYGRKPHRYRILYWVEDKGRTVFVLHIRHGARHPLHQA